MPRKDAGTVGQLENGGMGSGMGSAMDDAHQVEVYSFERFTASNFNCFIITEANRTIAAGRRTDRGRRS
jgi:hypothetical protein